MVAIMKHNMIFHDKFLEAKTGTFSILLVKGAKIATLPMQSLQISLVHRKRVLLGSLVNLDNVFQMSICMDT